ncbi:MAG: Gfo/Idh/MocA family oxidoreductase [Pirellulaceae bacterium]|nr:Gfo/Idh/MocA family oxidoreductase [Pirellulaceae bacterium]
MTSPMHHVLIVGVGSIGERHLRCFLGTGRVTASFVEINPSLRKTIADRYNVTGYADLATALATSGPPVTAAVVAAPANYHIELATQLAEARVHLLIEKPLSTSTDGIVRLAKIVDDHKLTAAVAYVLRGYPLIAALREKLHSGQFGSPVEIVVTCGQNFPTYRPAYRDTYYRHHATGGGAIQDALTHTLNAGEWLVGPIERLVADAAHQLLDGVDVEDTTHVLTRHRPIGGLPGKSILGSFSLNQHQAPNEVTITVICEQGTVRCEFHERRLRWMTKPDTPWQEEVLEPMERDTAFITQANCFLDAIEGRRAPVCTLAEGLQTLQVNLAALASVQASSWQQVPASPI